MDKIQLGLRATIFYTVENAASRDEGNGRSSSFDEGVVCIARHPTLLLAFEACPGAVKGRCYAEEKSIDYSQ